MPKRRRASVLVSVVGLRNLRGIGAQQQLPPFFVRATALLAHLPTALPHSRSSPILSALTRGARRAHSNPRKRRCRPSAGGLAIHWPEIRVSVDSYKGPRRGQGQGQDDDVSVAVLQKENRSGSDAINFLDVRRDFNSLRPCSLHKTIGCALSLFDSPLRDSRASALTEKLRCVCGHH